MQMPCWIWVVFFKLLQLRLLQTLPANTPPYSLSYWLSYRFSHRLPYRSHCLSDCLSYWFPHWIPYRSALDGSGGESNLFSNWL